MLKRWLNEWTTDSGMTTCFWLCFPSDMEDVKETRTNPDPVFFSPTCQDTATNDNIKHMQTTVKLLTIKSGFYKFCLHEDHLANSHFHDAFLSIKPGGKCKNDKKKKNLHHFSTDCRKFVHFFCPDLKTTHCLPPVAKTRIANRCWSTEDTTVDFICAH